MSSVLTIMKKKQQYKDGGIVTTSYMAKNRDSNILNMERLLLVWIEDCNQKWIPLSQILIQEKARSLFTDITAQREHGGENKNEG